MFRAWHNFYLFLHVQSTQTQIKNIFTCSKHSNTNQKYFYMFKTLKHKSKTFLHVQSIQTLRVDNPFLKKMFMFSTKCAPFLLKFGEEFNIDD